MKKLKVYVWESVFCDYSCGIAVGIATTKLGAIKAILGPGFDKESYSFKELLGIEPKVYPIEKITSIGWYSTGGS